MSTKNQVHFSLVFYLWRSYDEDVQIPSILSLAEASTLSSFIVGDKALQAAKLAALQIPLPKTFVIPTSTLEKIAELNGTNDWLNKNTPVLKDTKKNHKTLEKWWLNQQFPETITQKLLEIYKHFDTAFTAVSTSVGRTDFSYENITGEAVLAESILKVWWQSVVYQLQSSNEDETVSFFPITLIEQQQPLAAGYALTKNPITDHKTSFFIFSTWGVHLPDEKTTNLDGFEVDSRTYNVVSTNIVLKPHRYQRALDTLQQHKNARDKQDYSSLTAEEVGHLAQLLTKIKHQFFHHLLVRWELWTTGLVITDVQEMTEVMAQSLAVPSATLPPSRHHLKGIPVIRGVINGSPCIVSPETRRVDITSQTIVVMAHFSPSLLRRTKDAGGVIFGDVLSAAQLSQVRLQYQVPVLMGVPQALDTLSKVSQVQLDAVKGVISLLPKPSNHTPTTLTKVYCALKPTSQLAPVAEVLSDGVYITSCPEEQASPLLQNLQRVPVLYQVHDQLLSAPEYQGAGIIPRQWSVFDAEVKLLHQHARDTRATTGIVIPRVRAVQELRMIHHHLESTSPIFLRELEWWWSLSYPINLWELENYQELPFTGVIIDISQLFLHSYGLTHQTTDVRQLYQFSLHSLRQIVRQVKKAYDSSHHQPLPQVMINMGTDQAQPALLDEIVELGLDGVISTTHHAPVLKRSLAELEEHRLRNV